MDKYFTLTFADGKQTQVEQCGQTGAYLHIVYPSDAKLATVARTFGDEERNVHVILTKDGEKTGEFCGFSRLTRVMDAENGNYLVTLKGVM